MNFNKLRHVLEVKKCHSFSVAAERIGLTQSAITKNVASVEQELGFSIFDRTSKGVELTEEGRDFTDRMQRIITDADDLLQDVKDRQQKQNARLRVSVCPASLESLLVNPTTQWTQHMRDTLLEISTPNIDRAVQDIRTGDCDILLGSTSSFYKWNELQIIPLESLKSSLFARRDHPLHLLDKYRDEDLANYNFIAPSNLEPATVSIRDIYEKAGYDAHKRIHMVDYFPLVKRMVLNSDCFSIVSRDYAKTDHFQRDFKVLDLTDILNTIDICFAHDKRRPLKKVAKNFIHYFK